MSMNKAQVNESYSPPTPKTARESLSSQLTPNMSCWTNLESPARTFKNTNVSFCFACSNIWAYCDLSIFIGFLTVKLLGSFVDKFCFM